MEVRILKDGPYADFYTKPGKCGAQWLEVGERADFPGEYAQSLVDSGLARYLDPDNPLDYVPAPVPPALEPGEEAQAEEAEEAPALVPTAPAAKLMKEHGLTIEDVPSHGRNGKITTREVKAYLETLTDKKAQAQVAITPDPEPAEETQPEEVEEVYESKPG